MKIELPPIPENNVWFYIDEMWAKGITQELQSEVGPQHPLFHLAQRLVVIAKCGANDDVLALDPEETGQVYCIHLTWAGKHDQMPSKFPSFVKVSSRELAQFFCQVLKGK